MRLRKLNPNGKRSHASKLSLSSDSVPGTSSAFDPVAVIMACTRALLRTRDAHEISNALCRLLGESAQYADVSVTFAEEDTGARRRASSARKTEIGEITLPLIESGRTIAVLRLRTRDSRPPGEDELEALQGLADDAAYALARAQEDMRRTAVAAGERLPATFEPASVRIASIDSDTGPKSAEEAVRSERTLLRTIIDAVPHYIYVKDNHTRFTLVNKAWLEWRGLKSEQVHGKTVRELFPPKLADQMDAQDRALLTSGIPLIDVEQHLQLNTDDGGQMDRWSSTIKVPLRDAADRVIGLVGISRDITHSKRAEEAVRRERALLRTIIDALPDYIYVKDTQGRYQLANTAWLRARRVHSDELPGKTAFDVFPAAVAERLHQQDLTVLEHGLPMLDHEQPIYFRDQERPEARAWSSITKVPMRDDQGMVVGVVGISRDITARRRMERERAMEHVVARVVAESRSTEETMPRLIRTICEAMGWSYGARWMWDASAANLRRAEWWCDKGPDFDTSDHQYWMELGPHKSGGLLRRAWLDQRSTWLADIAQVTTFRRQASCLKSGFRSAYAFPIRAHEERLGVMEFFGREVREPDEALLQVTGSIANQIGQFIQRKQAEESLQESEQQLRAMFEHADVGIAVTGLDMRYLRVNDKFCSVVGYERDELLGMRTSDVNLNENVERMIEARQQMVSARVTSATMEKQLVRKDRSLVWVSMAVSLIRASDGTPRYFMSVVQDISESKRAAAALKESEEQFRQLAHYDMLTKLPNRVLFYDQLAQSLARAKRNDWTLAVMFIDVDRFKHVNDTFGHAAGDQLLKQVSHRLLQCVRADDSVGRLSGDEFAIALSRLAAAEDAATVAKRIVNVLNTPFQLEGADLYVTASIGITVFPGDSGEQDTLIRNADVAMYRAKERGRNNYQFYTPEMNQRTREMLKMQGELRRAIDREEFVLHFQPKVSLASRRITGVEALLRWMHPQRGLVSPADFIPLLEETGLIVQAGDWVLRAVCRQVREWSQAGIPLVPVAINLSPRQFLTPDLAQNIKQVLEQHEVGAHLLEVEITESSVMANAEEAIRTVEYLDALGVRTAIDDFGTGYSSLSYLKRFRLRALKIDRSFVRDITSDPDDATITQAVISMAHSLGLKVVAEGVETDGQLAFLAQYGCDEVQGFLFSRPVPGDACGALIRDGASVTAVLGSTKAR